MFVRVFSSLTPHGRGWKKPVAIGNEGMLQEKHKLLKLLLRMCFERVEAEEGLTPIGGVTLLPRPATLDCAAQDICEVAAVAAGNKKGTELHKAHAGAPAACTRNRSASIAAPSSES